MCSSFNITFKSTSHVTAAKKKHDPKSSLAKAMKKCNIYRDYHLTLYQTTNFRLFQTERVCRRPFHI